MNANTKSCILYVPKGTYDDYFISNWGVFDNIEEYDVTGIDNVTTSSDVKEISRYSVNGQRLDVPTKGLNIVKYSDGSVKKVVVQQYWIWIQCDIGGCERSHPLLNE